MELNKQKKKIWSTPHELMEYEIKRYQQQLSGKQVKVRSEVERVAAVKRRLNRHLLLLSSSDIQKVAGGKQKVSYKAMGLENIVTAIDKHVEWLKRTYKHDWVRLRSVFIDYVNEAVKTNMMLNNMSMDNLRLEIANYPKRSVDLIGLPFECPIFLMQQFSGEVQKKHFTSKFHHSDSAECKSIGENADFTLCIGTKDENARVSIRSTKARRDELKSEQVIKIDGEWNRIGWDKNFVVDREAREIRPKGAEDEIGSADVYEEEQGYDPSVM